MSSPKNRFWRVKLALLVLSTLLGVVALETAVRVAGLDNPILWEPDPRLGWHHVPRTRAHWTEEGDGHVRINTLGFRDAERSVRKESGVFRIAVFGDSTTEALQVDLEQTFCQLLEKRLNQRGIRAEVLNFGVSGYGSLQEYPLYSERGREFNPDLVLQAIFLDNDVADGDRRLATSQRGAPFLEDTPEPEFSVDYSAAVASAANYAREPVHTVRKLSAMYRMVSARRNKRASMSELAVTREAGGQVPRRFLLYQQPRPPEWQHAWQRFERVVARFADTVKRDGSTFALISVPAGQVVHPQVWQQLMKEYPAMSSRAWDLRLPEMDLRRFAENHHIPLIAPLDDFVRAASTDPLFFQQIGHLTPRGHDLMAAAVEATLVERGLLPPAPVK